MPFCALLHGCPTNTARHLLGRGHTSGQTKPFLARKSAFCRTVVASGTRICEVVSHRRRWERGFASGLGMVFVPPLK